MSARVSGDRTAPEQAFVFDCAGDALVGILHPGAPDARRGVVVVVGGPQTRVGSHRQFVLLARRLARAGIPVLRFDYRGMGDSEGAPRDFEDVGADLASAVSALVEREAQVREVVLWGLCDAASAALFYAARDPRVTGLVLLNPWVHTEQGEARAYLKSYYLARLAQGAFWRKLLSGGVDVRASLASLGGRVRSVLGGAGAAAGAGVEGVNPDAALPDRMAGGLDAFDGRVLLVLSGRDLTASEFVDLVARSPRWRELMADRRVERHDIADATHTFSSREWREQVESLTLEWLRRGQIR